MLFVDDDQFHVKQQGDGYRIGEMATTGSRLDYLKRRCLVLEFDGVQTMFSYMQTHMKTAKFAKASTGKDRSDFYHFPSYAEAMKVYTTRPEQVRDFDENDVKLTGGDSAGLDISYDITGDFLDVGRFLDGEPEMFGSMWNGNPRGRRCNIVLSVDWTSGTDVGFINRRAKRVIRLIDWLEGQGVRTSLTVVKSNACVHAELVIKRHEEPLELNDVAIVSHSDFLRRICFRLTEYSKTADDGYGSAIEFNIAMRQGADDCLKPELSSEIALFIGNYRHADIDREFDHLETELTELLESGDFSDDVKKVMASY